MCSKNTTKKWGGISQIFHWITPILFTIMLTIGLLMSDLKPGDDKWEIYGFHKAFGTTMLLIVTLRLWWRLTNAVPEDPSSVPHWQNFAARANIFLLYFFMFGYPLSGITMSLMAGHPIDYFGLFTIPSIMEGPNPIAGLTHEAHEIMIYGFLAFLTLHIVGAFYNHLYLKNDVLKRILPGYEPN